LYQPQNINFFNFHRLKTLEEEFKEYTDKTSQLLAQTKQELNEERAAKATIDKVSLISPISGYRDVI